MATMTAEKDLSAIRLGSRIRVPVVPIIDMFSSAMAEYQHECFRF